MNLTSLANVRAWVSSGTSITTDDALLTRLIVEASQSILDYLGRPDLGKTTITETISGRGERKIQLRNWPVLDVTALSIDGTTIPESTSATAWGFFLEPVYGATAGRPQSVGIRNSGANPFPIGSFPSGYGVTAYRQPESDYKRPFPQGVGNISATYSYGYCIIDESQSVPAATTYTITAYAPKGSFAQDLGVKYASSGTALTKVTGTPSTGQYSVSTVGLYTFAAGDASKAMLLSYDYIPAPIEQACIEMVGERYRYKSRIGLASTSMGGQETASYMVSDTLTASIKGRLKPYKLEWY